MKQNKYDNPDFFEKYSSLSRSQNGLQGAGEWQTLEKMLPDFKGKKVLDLGCGFGWHCQYAIEKGAESALGLDISVNMINGAKEKNNCPAISYLCQPIEDVSFPPNSFDIIISSLALHYIESFDSITQKVAHLLTKEGVFIFSVEHPIFTALGNQEWFTDEKGNKLHWPVDNYFIEGKRNSNFLGEDVIKYHNTLTTYLNTLITNGFEITEIIEPQPSKEQIENIEEMKDELRRPMMLIISAKKK